MSKSKKIISRSVFVVEDDLELSSVIDRILLSIDSNINLEWATTAEEAMTTLIKKTNKNNINPYDLMICDVFLEGVGSGVDLWKFCHANFPSMKVVIISGIEPEKITTLINSPNAKPLFLQKPFSVKNFSNLMEKLLNEF